MAHLMGIGGWLMMLMPVVYVGAQARGWMRNLGSLRLWLEAHIFCGIVGPVLVTFHTAFKFNGLVSVAYWSMIAVALSGFVGRYLYVRIPAAHPGRRVLPRREVVDRDRRNCATRSRTTTCRQRPARRHRRRGGDGWRGVPGAPAPGPADARCRRHPPAHAQAGL